MKNYGRLRLLRSVIWCGKYVMVDDADGFVYLFGGDKLRITYRFRVAKYWIEGLSFNSKYSLLTVASEDNYVYVYDLSKVVKVIPTLITTTVPAVTTTTIKTVTIAKTQTEIVTFIVTLARVTKTKNAKGGR